MKAKNILVENLERIRKFRGETHAEFAESIGIPRSTLNDILSSGNTTVDTLMRISGGLKLPVWRLFFDSRREVIEPRIAYDILHYVELMTALPADAQYRIAYGIEEVFQNELNDADAAIG